MFLLSNINLNFFKHFFLHPKQTSTYDWPITYDACFISIGWPYVGQVCLVTIEIIFF